MTSDPWAEYERLSEADPDRLTDDERRLLALGRMRADLNNGGFDQYFFNSAGNSVVDAIDAADSAEATALAALVRRAVDKLGVSDPWDRDARQARLDEVDDDLFDDLDGEYQALEAASDLDEVMRRFTR